MNLVVEKDVYYFSESNDVIDYSRQLLNITMIIVQLTIYYSSKIPYAANIYTYILILGFYVILLYQIIDITKYKYHGSV